MSQRLSSRDYWASLYSPVESSPAPSANRLRHWIPAPLRRLRKKLLQRHHTFQLVECLLAPLLGGREGLRGLEIGSAPGYRSLGLWRRVAIEPWGIEYTDSGVAAQKALYRQEGLPEDWVVRGDFFDEKLRAPWRDHFDVVASYGFIEHFDEPVDVVRKHMELLKPGGLLVLTVPNLNPTTWYGRLVRRFNPAVYQMHNIATCTSANFCTIAQSLTGQVVFCGPLGGPDLEFLPDRRWPGRFVSGLCRVVNPILNVFNHILLGRRLWAFPRSSSTLALVAIKSGGDAAS